MMALKASFLQGFDRQYLDDVRDVVTQLCERGQDRPSRCEASGSVKEYVNGAAGIHVHMRIRPRDSSFPPGEFCCLIERASKTDEVEVQVDIAHIADANAESTKRTGGGRERPVLVHVIEFTENPERVSIRVIDSVVWLHPLDECEDWSTNRAGVARNVDSAGTSLWTDTRIINRESGSPAPDLRGASLDREQLVGKMIQRRAQVVDTVPNQRGPEISVGMDNLARLGDELSFAAVVLANEAIRVRAEELRHLVFDGLEVRIGPTKLGIDAAERRYKSHNRLPLEDDDRRTGATDARDSRGPHHPGADA